MNEITMQNYETKCLFEIINAVINKTEIPNFPTTPRWAMMYGIADYHNLGNILYYGALGVERKNNIQWKEKAEKRYHSAIHGEEWYTKAVDDLIKYFENSKVHCMILKDYLMRDYYPRKEHRPLRNVRILVDNGSEEMIAKILSHLDYEEQESENPEEKVYTKIPGVTLIIQNGFIFQNKRLKKFFANPVKDAPKKQGYSYVHEFSKENFYTYIIVNAADSFTKATVDIREMLDIWCYYRSVYKLLDFSIINENLEIMDLEKFHSTLMKVISAWFGGIETGTRGDNFFACEQFVLTKGANGREGCARILPPLKDVTEIYEKELKRKRRREIRQWIFPPLSYMVGMFPSLEKRPSLIGFYWIFRLIRIPAKWFARKADSSTLLLRNKVKRTFRMIKVGIGEFFTKIKNFFGTVKRKIRIYSKKDDKK